MSKKVILLSAVLIGSMSVSGEISPKELKQYSRAIHVDSVRADTDKDDGTKKEVLTVDFSGGDKEEDAKYLEKTWVRLMVEVTDKATKATYLISVEREHGAILEEGAGDNRYTGEGHWDLVIPYTDQMRRMKISAYALQYGVKDGDNFIPFIEEYDGVKSSEELIKKTPTPYPGKYTFNRIVYVEEQ